MLALLVVLQQPRHGRCLIDESIVIVNNKRDSQNVVKGKLRSHFYSIVEKKKKTHTRPG